MNICSNQCKLKLGLLDADVYGPSVPTMMNIHQKPEVTGGNISIFQDSLLSMVKNILFVYQLIIR